MKIGIVPFSFAWREEGISPCNDRLFRAAMRVIRWCFQNIGCDITIVGQRTMRPLLLAYGFKEGEDFFVLPKEPGYEDSKRVMLYAKSVFESRGIENVIPIAHTWLFLHLFMCWRMVKKLGFRIPISFLKLSQLIGPIGLDPLSVQPQTWGPISELLYTFRKVVLHYSPPEAESEP